MAQSAETSMTSAWGTNAWFSHQFACGNAQDPTAYFAHGVCGYQVFRHQTLCTWLGETLKTSEVRSLADIGCGTGVLTHKLTKQFSLDHAVGIDFLAEAVEQARTCYAGIEFQTGVLPTLELETERFDLVVASEVLYYLSEQEQRQAVSEIARILRPGGVMLFTSRLGGRYFSTKSASELLQVHFNIERQAFLHNRVYNSLTRPIRGLRKLGEFAAASQGAARWPHIVLNNPVSKLVYKVSGITERRILRSSLLPAACHRLSQTIAPAFTRSNLILLCRKG